MTDDQINIAIAEACGYTGPFEPVWLGPGDRCGISATHPDSRRHYIVPNYTNDLNAMHEAEKLLTKEQQKEFSFELYYTLCPNQKSSTIGWWDLNCAEAFRQSHATARQRAEAFLRTLNLWKA